MSDQNEFTALQGELRSLDGRRSDILKRLAKLQESQVHNDYLDDFSALTKSMFKKRLTAYRAMGYRIEGVQ